MELTFSPSSDVHQGQACPDAILPPLLVFDGEIEDPLFFSYRTRRFVTDRGLPLSSRERDRDGVFPKAVFLTAAPSFSIIPLLLYLDVRQSPCDVSINCPLEQSPLRNPSLIFPSPLRMIDKSFQG